MEARSVMTDEEFYARCAEILDAEHEYLPFAHHARTRWNNRRPGCGRFPGRGMVRLFGERVHIALRHPMALHVTIEGRQAALDMIERTINENGKTSQ